jgi:hypothetical protein
MLPLSDGLRARRFPIVTIALIVANWQIEPVGSCGLATW